MLDRTMEKKIENFFRTESKSALMITGARQVGRPIVFVSLQESILNL